MIDCKPTGPGWTEFQVRPNFVAICESLGINPYGSICEYQITQINQVVADQAPLTASFWEEFAYKACAFPEERKDAVDGGDVRMCISIADVNPATPETYTEVGKALHAHVKRLACNWASSETNSWLWDRNYDPEDDALQAADAAIKAMKEGAYA